VSEQPVFEKVHKNVWMRCNCGYWLAVERVVDDTLHRKVKVTCHNRQCNQTWEHKGDTWVEVT
jgi:hypothetical protein